MHMHEYIERLQIIYAASFGRPLQPVDNQMTQPLDHQLNTAILEMASTFLPEGFDVSDDAPQTFNALKDHLKAGKRLIVYGEGCEGTIYADPRVNYAFRAWH